MTLRDLFNSRRWHHHDLDALVIWVRHRGAKHDERLVHGRHVADVGPKGLHLRSDGHPLEEDLTMDEDDQIFLPYHRVLRVLGPSGQLWPPAS